MKLKRFLLRYEPPGVGLEVEEDGQISVVHKDLPAAALVSTPKDVKLAVDELIAGEELLTRKRHRSALITLLGRLYQIEVDPADEEDADNDKHHQKSPQAQTHASVRSSSPDVISEGQNVVLCGLTDKLQVHNGEMGSVVKAKPDKNKYEVDVKGEVIKVKGAEHLLPVSRSGLAVGAYVAIRGLRNHVELNGCIARVAECYEDAQRYEVRAVETQQLFRVKKDNLIPIEPSPTVLAAANAAKENREPNVSGATPRKKEGSLPSAFGGNDGLLAGDNDGVLEVGAIVELTGLKTAHAYNGQAAEVLSIDRVRNRYEIRLNDGSVKTIRAENVKLLNAKSSPRAKRKDK
jgi:hypothetical protein